MGTGNGDLVREATMRQVRHYVRAGIADGRDPGELAVEVIRTYDLTPVEAGLARTMISNYMKGRGMAADQTDASRKNVS
jgi:hypothetical protein